MSFQKQSRRLSFLDFVIHPFKTRPRVDKLNKRGISYYQKEEFGRAITCFETAFQESLVNLPRSVRKDIRRRSLSHSVVPNTQATLKTIRFPEKKFYKHVESLSSDYSPQTKSSIIMFNIAQAKVRNEDFQGAMKCFQRSFFVQLDETSPVFLPILHNTALIFDSLVGPADTIILFRNCLGTVAEKWHTRRGIDVETALKVLCTESFRVPKTSRKSLASPEFYIKKSRTPRSIYLRNTSTRRLSFR